MEQQMIANGGLQYVPQIAVQYVYLDFDGELTSYNGEILTVDNVEVKDSSLTEKRITDIVAELNAKYADKNVIFVTEKPQTAEYSTIFIGKTEAFAPYGNFAGLAETIDFDNQNKTDKAFVLLDSTASDEAIISTISHETDHLLGTLNHGGEKIDAYADNYNVSSGQISIGKELNDGNCMIVDGTASKTTINYGSMYVYGNANDTVINDSWGELRVCGGTASNTIINAGCMIVVAGEALFTTVNNGYVDIDSGGIANNITVSSNAAISIYGGTVNNTVINSGGRISFYGGNGTALTLSSGGKFGAFSFGRSIYFDYISNGTAFLDSNVSMTRFLIDIGSGGTARDIVIDDGGSMYISSGGTANNIAVNSWGSLYISSGGTATDIDWTPCIGDVFAEKGAYVTYASNYSGVYVGSRHNLVSQANSMYEKTVSPGCSMYVMNGGIADNTTVVGYRDFRLENGNGNMFVSSGGNAQNTVLRGGVMHIYSGGQANSTTVMYSTSKRYDGGQQRVESHAGSMYIYGGGRADKTTVYELGDMFVADGGTVSNTVLSGAYADMHISNGGEAYKTTVKWQGRAYIYSGGTANKTTVEAHGYLSIRGGTSIDATVSGGSTFIDSDGVANNTILNNLGYIYISSGGTANSTTVNSGTMFISSGGVANSTMLSGFSALMEISSGGVANNTTINNGSMFISSGGICRGVLNIGETSFVSAYSGSIIDFTIADRSIEDGYIINNLSGIYGTPDYTITVSDTQAVGTYKLAQNSAGFSGTISIGSDTARYGSLTVNEDALIYNDTAYSLNNTNGNLTLTVKSITISDLHGNNNGIVWNSVPEVSCCTVAYSQNNFANSLQLAPGTDAVDTYGMPAGTYQWKVSDGETWYNGDTITAAAASDAQTLISDHDGDMDLFFGNANGTWEAGFSAEHQGVYNNWIGSRELAALEGKNKISDVFAGSDDANILVLTDDTNGDALFVDDVYTAFGKDAARLSQIDEIRAGLGDDVVDLTSQRFAYVGDGVKVYGGLGNDTIWSNNGNNTLFGDAGNDRLVGGSGNDFIIGGSGNDSMHGGGGEDIFCFGDNWGTDTIEQLSTGSVTLYFEEGEISNWNAATMTYTAGNNSVKVSGVTDVTLKFGTDATLPSGCFDDTASEKIFEDKNKGMLA